MDTIPSWTEEFGGTANKITPVNLHILRRNNHFIMGLSNYLWTNISFIIMFMLHMVQHRIRAETLNSGTLEEN